MQFIWLGTRHARAKMDSMIILVTFPGWDAQHIIQPRPWNPPGQRSIHGGHSSWNSLSLEFSTLMPQIAQKNSSSSKMHLFRSVSQPRYIAPVRFLKRATNVFRYTHTYNTFLITKQHNMHISNHFKSVNHLLLRSTSNNDLLQHYPRTRFY